MCEFISWKEKNGKVYFLSDDQLKTREGKELIKTIPTEELCGHGAINEYYGDTVKGAINHECTDFSSTKYFPPEIVKMIIEGKFRLLKVTPIGLLTDEAKAIYNAKCKPLEDDYYAKYKPLIDDYNAKCKPLEDDYDAKRKLLIDDYYAKCKLLNDDYN